jgi:exosome complex RNA-binding protein Rrp42 (RNase PH superfamily)
VLERMDAKWIIQGVAVGVRDDGRNVLDVRPSSYETNVLVTCVASAHVVRGDCDVVAGVKLELSPPQNNGNQGGVFVKVKKEGFAVFFFEK